MRRGPRWTCISGLAQGLILALALSLTLGFTLTGCGSSAKVEASPGAGRELQDLQDAYDKGLLTEEDYKKQRQAILNK